MVKNAQKEPEIHEEELEEEVQGPRKSGHRKAGNKNSDSESPGQPTAFYLHSMMLIAGRLLHKVLDFYNSLFDLTPQDKATIYRNISTSYTKKGLHEKALEHLEEWARFEPSNPDAHYQLGIALAVSGNSSDSIKAFDKVFELKPKHRGAMYHKSSLYLKIKEFKKAVAGFEALLKETPDNPKVYYKLGVAYDSLDEIEKAIKVINKAAELDPDEVNYQQHLGLLNARKDDHKTAAKYFTRVMELEREMEEEAE